MSEIVKNLPKICVSVDCNVCHNTYDMFIYDEDYDRYKQGVSIQDAFPYLTPAEREILISGICGYCFDNMFKNFDEE